jgi:hypothetical protein
MAGMRVPMIEARNAEIMPVLANVSPSAAYAMKP